MPILNRALTRSAPRSAMRLASSWTVIASGTTTSRTCLAARAGLHDGARFSFSRARRSAASERARLSSSSDRARRDGELAATGGDRRRGRGVGRAGSGRLRRRRMAAGRRKLRSSVFVRHGGSGRFGGLRRRSCGCGERLFLGRRAASSAAASSALRFSSARRFSSSLWPNSWLVPRGGALPRARSGGLPRPRAAGAPAAPCGCVISFGRGRPARLRSCRRSRLRRWCGRAALRRRARAPARRSFARAAEDAALLDLDHDRVRAAVAEALLDLAGLDRALEAQRRPGAKLRFFGLVCHSIPSSNLLQPSRGPRRVLRLPDHRSGPVKARHRASAWRTREAAAGSVRATCTTFSRPKRQRQDSASLGEYQPLAPPRRRRPARPGRACGGRPRRRRRRGAADGPCLRARRSRSCRSR